MHQIRDARSKHTHTHSQKGRKCDRDKDVLCPLHECVRLPAGRAGGRATAGKRTYAIPSLACKVRTIYVYIYIYIWLCNSNYLFKLFLRCILNEGIVPFTCGGRENASVCVRSARHFCAVTRRIYSALYTRCVRECVRACVCFL